MVDKVFSATCRVISYRDVREKEQATERQRDNLDTFFPIEILLCKYTCTTNHFFAFLLHRIALAVCTNLLILLILAGFCFNCCSPPSCKLPLLAFTFPSLSNQLFSSTELTPLKPLPLLSVRCIGSELVLLYEVSPLLFLECPLLCARFPLLLLECPFWRVRFSLLVFEEVVLGSSGRGTMGMLIRGRGFMAVESGRNITAATCFASGGAGDGDCTVRSTASDSSASGSNA